MAYQQSELVNVLGLETVFIRGPDNYPISSQYVLYANGFGQGYWSNSVLPENLSTLSTSLGSTNLYIQQLSSSQGSINQSTLSTTNALQSTISTATNYSISTTNALLIAVDSFYQSSVNYTNSTVLGISTQSTFFAEIGAVQSSVNASASSLSTAIYVQNASTYSSITLQTDFKISTASANQRTALNNFSTYVSLNFASISSVSSIQGNFSNALASTSLGLTSSIQNLSSYISTYAYQTYASTNSTFSSIFSTLNLHSTQIKALQNFSSTSYSTSYMLASTFAHSTQVFILSTNVSTVANLQGQISANSTNTANLNSTFLNYASTTTSTISSLTLEISSISDSLSSLWFQFDLLTTSSILSSIYTSFVELEQYFNALYYSTSTGVTSSIENILQSSYAYNQSTADAFFATFVSSVYASTISTVVPSTMAYVSTLISTLYSSLYYDLNSTLQETVVSSLISTTYGYLSTISPELTSNVVSTLATEQVLLLSNTTSNAVMDFVTYRNFYINVNNLTDPFLYKIMYLSNTISSLNYSRGIITIDISTVGNMYSANSSLLILDTNHYGYPTAVSERYIPYVSNANYTMQYEYNILNQIVYTNLLGVYPRLNVTSLNYSTISTVNSVYSNGAVITNYIWRNTPLIVNWSNYSFFPFSTFGGPTLNPQVQLVYNINSTTVQTYGPYPFSQSTATIQLPMISSATSAFVSTSISAYVLGTPANAASQPFITLLPAFNSVLLSSISSGIRPSGTALIGLSRTGVNTLSSYSFVNVSTSAGISSISTGFAFGANFFVNNIISSIGNSFVGPNNTVVVPAVAIISSINPVSPANAFSTIIYSNCVSTGLSSIAPSTNAQFMQLFGIVKSGATEFSRKMQLTSSITTSFSL